MAENTKAIALSAKDNVATALVALKAGATVAVKLQGRTSSVRLLADIPMGHKFALLDITSGAPVVKYGEPIGRSAAKIIKGDHVHVHNVTGRKGSEG